MRRQVNRKKLLEAMDLSVTCPLCGERIEPARQMRLSMDGTMRCPACGREFLQPTKKVRPELR
jgi:transposase